MTHEEGLLVERPSPPSHQEQEGHSISGNREHGRQSTGVHDDWNAVTIRRQQHSGRPHEMDVLFDSGAATSRCQQCFSDSLGGKPSGAGVYLRSATIHHYGSHTDLHAHTSWSQRVGRLADRAQDDRPAEINHWQNHRVSQVMWNTLQQSDRPSDQVRTRWWCVQAEGPRHQHREWLGQVEPRC